MKKIISISFFLLLTNLSSAQYNWKNIGPGGGSDLKCIAINPINPDVVYIGGDIEGIYKTTNGGNTWQNINNNLAFYSPGVYYVQNIVFDPSDNSYNTLFICTTIGLFKTINGGENWVPILPSSFSTEDDFVSVSFLTLDPTNSNIIYVGTGVPYDDEDGKGIIFKSIDGGTSWNELSVGTPTSVIHGIYIDPLSDENNRTIYASTNDGFYKSADNGNSWVSKNNGLPHNKLRRIKGIIFDNQLTLYLTLTTLGTPGNPNSFNGGIYKSTDGGENWIDINGNLPKYQEEETLFYFYWKFALHPQNKGEIYIATTRGWPDEGLAGYYDWGIYKTTDDGITWNKINNNVEFGWLAPDYFVEDNAFILEISPSNPDVIYWGLVWMAKTIDGGNSWSQIYSTKAGDYWKGNGLELMAVDVMEFDPVDPNKTFVGYDDFGLFKSIDGGESYKPLEPMQDPYEGYDAVKDIIIDPDNNIIYQSRWEGIAGAISSQFELGQVWKSTDDGETWIKSSNGLPDGTPKLKMDYNSNTSSRILYCTIYKSGVYKSIDNGENWQAINNGLNSDAAKAWEIVIDPSNSNNLYLGLNGIGSGGGIYFSNDGGSNWTKSAAFPNYDILSLEVDDNGTTYAGAVDNFDYNSTGGLYKSSDSGSSWELLFENSRVIDIEIHPFNNNKIYITSQTWFLYNPDLQKGVFESTDGGANWTDLTGNIANTYTRFIKLNPHSPSEIYLGTNGGGIWKLNLSTTDIKNNYTLTSQFTLEQNYPNPFNPETTISFSIPATINNFENVSLKIYDILGKHIKTIFNKRIAPGFHKIKFNASNFTSGIYFYRLSAGSFSKTRKMVLLK